MARAIDGDALFCKFWSLADPYVEQEKVYPCKIWNQAATMAREAPAITPPNKWISVEERLPKAEQEVLVACKTRTSGYRYQCQGFYVPRGIYREDSEFTWDYEACDEYDEERDDYLVNEGWYERIHNWDEYGAVSISDIVTHWMPLPEPPEAPHE